ncbi:ShlB/FhaC/HecB family hemolysin secretion/activation protein [Niveispirillum sp. KHB5.9]|uniref:ShlB/FhaC/HecB family hemolysin secretion/activation protein n=1 Tax=Niveispirillum sp. KHB5.9 TaxID=3400269 RepID=UPI003A876427
MRRCLAFLGVAAVLAPAGAAAQSAPGRLPGSVEPGRPTVPAPLEELRRAPKAQLQFSIPAQRKGAPAAGAADLRFTLSRIAVEGAAAIDPQTEFAADIAALIARPVTLADISALADRIQARYLALGYGLTRVFVPAQELRDQTITIRVIEGHLERARVEGGGPRERARVEARLADALAARPARVELIERGLLLVDDLPGVTVTGLIRPGDSFGAAELLVGYTETPYAMVAGVGNRGSEFAGPWSAFVDLAANSPFGLGEQLGVTLSATPQIKEQRSANGRWVHPLEGSGLSLTSAVNYSRGRPGASLKPFAVATESYGMGQRLSLPLIRSRARNLTLEVGWNAQAANVALLNLPFSRDRWRSLDARATYSQLRFLGGDLYAQLGVTQGLDVAGATVRGDAAASRLRPEPWYSKFNAEVAYGYRLPADIGATLTVAGQYTPDTLLAGEEFALGGSRFGRGYNGGDLSGPNGVGGGLELRRSFNPGIERVEGLTLYGFLDTGRVWDSVAASTHLVSAGGGVRLGLFGKASLSAELARTLRALPIPGAEGRRTRLFIDLTVQI